MSVTFRSNVSSVKKTTKTEPCLCSQMADSWILMIDGEDSEAIREDLRAHANPECPLCKGTGVEEVEESDAPELDLNEGNAHSLFSALGIEWDPCGQMGIADAHRALMRARSRKDLRAFTREEEVTYGAPRADENGVVELRPLRSYSQALTVEQVQERIGRFASFVEQSSSRGATAIAWS